MWFDVQANAVGALARSISIAQLTLKVIHDLSDMLVAILATSFFIEIPAGKSPDQSDTRR